MYCTTTIILYHESTSSHRTRAKCQNIAFIGGITTFNAGRLFAPLHQAPGTCPEIALPARLSRFKATMLPSTPQLRGSDPARLLPLIDNCCYASKGG